MVQPAESVDNKTICLDAGHWTLDIGRWTLDAGHWTLDVGHWTLDIGRWKLDVGPWTLDAGRWTLDIGKCCRDAIPRVFDFHAWANFGNPERFAKENKSFVAKFTRKDIKLKKDSYN
jgi:hypothetical protein